MHEIGGVAGFLTESGKKSLFRHANATKTSQIFLYFWRRFLVDWPRNKTFLFQP
jgi:hypothetical protein